MCQAGKQQFKVKFWIGVPLRTIWHNMTCVQNYPTLLLSAHFPPLSPLVTPHQKILSLHKQAWLEEQVFSIESATPVFLKGQCHEIFTPQFSPSTDHLALCPWLTC